MRILYITQWFEPEPVFKGIAFARALADAGHEVQVATGFPNYPGGNLYKGYKLRPFGRETMDGVSVHRLPLWPSHDRSTLGRIANYSSFFLSTLFYCLFAMRRYDVVYIYHPPITPSLAGALAGFVRRVPFVIDIQDLWPDSVAVSGMGNSRLVSVIDRLCRFTYRRAAHVVCQSDGIAARLVERGVAPGKITRVYNWSNYLPPEADEPPVPAAIEEAMAGRVNVVYGGNLGQAQAMECLVEAAIRAQREVPELRLHIVGNGIERDAIARLAAAAPDAVRLHDPLPRRVMDRVFDRADILALHLKDDPLFDITIPSKLQHYLSVGRPIVAGIGGEAARILDRSGAARVAPAGDPAGLAAHLVEIARKDGSEREAMGEAGAAFYRRELSFGAALDRTIKLMQDCVRPSRPA